MKISSVLLCVAAVLTIAVNGCPVGRTFLTAFMANLKASHPHASLELVIIAHKTRATVKTVLKCSSFTRTVQVEKGSSARVLLPPSVEMQGAGSSNQTVLITSDADISVVAFNNKLSSGDSSIVLPTTDLGTDYMIYTPDIGPSDMDKLVAIINGKDANIIVISPYKNMAVRGIQNWYKGRHVVLTMAPYEVYQLRSSKTFTGTRIKSTRPVAILGGHQCADNGISCTHIYQQLFPVQKLATHWLVPVMRDSKDAVHVLAIEDNTKVSIARGKQTKTKDLTAGQTWVMGISGKTPLSIDSSQKVMVVYFSMNRPFNPFFMSILPQSELSNDWTLETQASFASTAVLISEANGVKTTRMDGKPLPRQIKWSPFPTNDTFLWTKMQLGKSQQHISITSDALIAVYVYGGKWAHSYSTAGVCYKGTVSPETPDACESIKCREKEQCKKGVCVHISKATCWAVGDPHFRTFDGKRLDFQGTCTYAMSTTVGNDKGLTPFTVLIKNNHRGNNYVSFVRKVTIIVYNTTITISDDKGIVEVNGVKSNLPISLVQDKLRIEDRNSYAVLTAESWLEVSYDWNAKVYVTVTSSYFGSLGGLCGNYNGDRTDEFTTPKGESASTILDFAKSWKRKDGDIFCHDDCKGNCPSCSVALQEKYKSEDFCGLMAKSGGPFDNCHKVLDPGNYVDNCVYDVCINKGMKKLVCDNLEAYARACNTEGVKLSKWSWREQANCSMDCPENSHFESCGTACPASCTSLEGSVCPQICVEGCQCNKGFVLSGDKCVPKRECGCMYSGQYYTSGQEFWADSKCTRRCQCNPQTAMVECSQKKCKTSEVCALRDGVRDCYPTSFATCQGSGDPHYRTFHGKRLDFQGTCTYYLSKLVKTTDPSLVPFEVLVQNQNRGGNKLVSYTKTVEISVYGHTLILSKEMPGKVMLNGLYSSLPFQLEDGTLSAFKSGYFGVVQTDFGLTLKFNWNSHVKLTLPSAYSGQVGGLCGNWNRDGSDDMVTTDNRPAGTAAAFGDSWKARDHPGCSGDCGGKKCPVCEPAAAARYQQRELCGMIADGNGPFKLCHDKVDPRPYMEDCVYDMCLYGGHASGLCGALAAYTSACQEVSATVDAWRSDSFCPVSCTENSHYEVCAPGCRPTCSELFAPVACDGMPCAEGCTCSDGFLWSGNTCVPVAECGCARDGHYYKAGQVFFPEAQCDVRCVCLEGGVVQCNSSFACGPNERCQIRDGVRACFPDGTGTCSVFGASSYRTLDGRAFNLTGSCQYVLAEIASTAAGVSFSVSAEQASIAGEWPVTRRVQIKVNEYKISLFPGTNWEATVDGVKQNLPLSLSDDKLKVYQNGFYIVVEATFGLRVSYDSVSGVVVEVPSTYRGAMRGLCGDYDGNPANDLALPSRLPASSTETFAEAWAVAAQDGTKCQTGCGSECPSPDKKKKADAEKACGVLTQKDGPLSPCLAAAPPQKYFDECVLEMMTWQLDGKTLCRHIQRYVAVCHSIGITVGQWRTATFCPVQCPANSHYELCADTCSSTCASLSVSPRCPGCREGCQCDDGFVFDGGLCVPLSGCGCAVNGRYYKSGQSVVQTDCTETCACKNGVLSCKNSDCDDGEICLVKKGVMGCYSTDPCVVKNCREKEDCVLQDSVAMCVPKSKAYCWAMGDPHYQNFDGKFFEFQGTCSYVLVRTNGKDPTLSAFSVETKNGMRGNPRGSFLKSVLIKMKGHQIFIPYMDRGKLMIDGILSNIPISLDSGSIKITQSGIRGTLTLDSAVEIVFDWVAMLMVTVTSSYYNNLAGLCGTYNGDQSDDQTAASGAVVANVTEWARSWTVPDGDPFCWHSCRGDCPICTDAAQKLYSSERYCGLLLTEDGGPFSQCHGTVAPEEFVSGCLYDVCLNNGRQNVLCEVLASYVGACQQAESTVSPKWREISNCPFPCPENSHYELCSSPCPATCAEPMGRVNCSLPCSEGCQCNDGLVMSGSRCVAMDTGCGCMLGTSYYKPEETFWEDAKCRRKCTCDGATQTLQCRDKGCKAGEYCGVVDGVLDCYPTRFDTCRAQGDPHFRSFDGRPFDFQGNCVYLLAGVSADADAAELHGFNVTLENANRGSRRVSFAKVVTVTVERTTFTVSQNYPGKVLVDGILTSLPYYFNDTTVRVFKSGQLLVLEAHFGLRVTYDWSSSVRVTVPSMYRGAMRGLCGNYNGDPSDDFLLPGGGRTSDATEFGNSYLVAEVPGCSHTCSDCAAPQTGPGAVLPPYTANCDVIADKNGPLRACAGKVDAALYRQNCVYDIVLNQGLQKAACDIISAYVEECQDAGVQIEPWRRKDFCPLACPKNSVYSLTAPGCPATCYGMGSTAGCRAGAREGCQCEPGFLVSDERCVPFQDCGCRYEGRYFRSGASFYTDGSCRRRCACRAGMVDCQETACGEQETCALVQGVRRCAPQSQATCALSGDSHFRTFDGRDYDFRGPCGHTLAQASEGAGAAGLERFRVSAETAPGEEAVPLRSVRVEMFGLALVLERDAPWEVEVDGIRTNLPASLSDGKLTLSQEGKGVVLEAGFGLRLTYDLQGTVAITLPSVYRGQLSGLCGDYNGQPGDDLKLPSGAPTDDVSAFGAAWRLGGDEGSCGSACPAGGCAGPGDGARGELEGPQRCGLIADAAGPLAACHSALPPAGFLQNCVYNSFVAGGKAEDVCQGIAAYVSACQAAGVTLKSWRTKDFCPAPACPAHSHYELCASACDRNCMAFSGQSICPAICLEGCQCDEGFVADGNQCVPLLSCGCSVNGTYLKSGETVYVSQCSQKCTCHSRDTLACEDTACPAKTECAIAGGFLGCRPTESTCTLTNGSWVTAFDGQKLRFWGKGHYQLVQSECLDPSSERLQVGANVALTRDGPSLAGVLAAFGGTKVIVLPHSLVWVNNEPVPLPWQSPNGTLLVSEAGGAVSVQYRGGEGATVSVSAGGDLSVTVPNGLLDRVSGLCAPHRTQAQRAAWGRLSITKQAAAQLGRVFVQNWLP
ncbi:IgGFc-binding protein-like isoform X1 [Anguilla rostrata]|uniref:IgGFc-binding protein-like isoform X1 n=1 Tax=Anguilla rostrata TaxID=7938 RepID=UPI0030CFA5BA